MVKMRQAGKCALRALCGLTIALSLQLFAQVTTQPASQASDDKPVTLDRVVAIVNGDVLLASDVNEEMRLAALQPISVPQGQNTSLRAARRLVSRALILRQMHSQQQIDYKISDDDVRKNLMDLRNQIPVCKKLHCATDAGWQEFLKANGLSDQEVFEHWKQRLEILKFIQARFGPGIRIPQADIEKYYQANVVPAFTKNKQTPPKLDGSVESRIKEILLQQQVNALLRDWLQSLREQGSVQVLDPTYAQLAPKGDEDDEGGE